MSIRSVDFQMLVPKTQQLSRDNQQLNDKVRFESQQHVQDDKKIIEQKMNRINAFDEKNKLFIYDQNNKKKNNQQDTRNKRQKKRNSEEGKKQTVGSRIDIKI